MEGVLAAPIEGVPDGDGFVLDGAGSWRMVWSVKERGWLLGTVEDDRRVELGRTSSSEPEAILAPSSVLLADGRLFRLAWIGASAPRVELGRWDVPGAYLVARAEGGDWVLERTAAGVALEAGPELLILACAEIGRLDGWF